MPKQPPPLSKRERQIMDVLYRLGRATAAEVQGEMADAPTYTTVRGLLRILEGKGHIRHEQEGTRYVYLPTAQRQVAGASHLSHVVRTFFGGSASTAVAALLGPGGIKPTEADLKHIEGLIAKARARR